MQDEINTETADSVENTAITEEVAPVAEPVSETKSISSNMSAEDFISSRLGDETSPKDEVEDNSKTTGQAVPEVDEEAKPQVGEFEVRQQLRFEYGQHLFDGFELHNHGVVDQQVEAESRFEPQADVDDREADLFGEGDAALFQFVAHTSLIDRFHEAWTQSRVDLVR